MTSRGPWCRASLAAAIVLGLSVGASGQQSPQPQAAAAAGVAAAPSAAVAPEAAPLVSSDDSAPAAPRDNYRIGAGDVLDIRVLPEDKMSTVVKVSEDGFIRFPFIDEDVRAQCMTERELGVELAEKLKKYLKYPEVFVAVKEYNATIVAVMGAVTTPGRFKLERRVRLIELLTFAGGVTTTAGSVLHLVHLSGSQSCDAGTSDVSSATGDASETINVTKLMEGDLREDRVMHAGDIIIVPLADQVFVAGEVLKPNAYPLRDGMTLTQALAIAGGPSPIAKVGEIRIVRQEPGKPRQEIPVDLKAIQNNKAPDPRLVANDLIEVPDSSGKKFLRSFVTALGGSASQLPIRVIP